MMLADGDTHTGTGSINDPVRQHRDRCAFRGCENAGVSRRVTATATFVLYCASHHERAASLFDRRAA